ncbi:MAG TPA: hemolysin III family protein [Candidatus Hydrogenedentes bacterium]|nr:hemolysin III family protein [Candidatus Hydrogenedentota bacterium]
MSHSESKYTVGEEIANAITHGLGVLFSIAALTLMVIYASLGGDPWRIVSVSIFGATLIILYLASTLYHAIPQPRAKKFLRVFDHSAIYLLIAGTYTPFLLVSMRGPWGWSLFGALWGIAVAGCTFKFFFIGRWDILSTILYIAMGWTALVVIKPALEMIPLAALGLMAAGGLVYTIGTLFYAWGRLPYNHAIWHVFVLAASAIHIAAVFFFVIPTPMNG